MTGESLSKRKYLLPFVLLIGIVLIVSLTLAYRGPLPTWGDETYTIRLANTTCYWFWDEIKKDVHPPLYFTLSKLVGDFFVDKTEIWCPAPPLVRVLAYLFFLALIWETIRLLKRRVERVEAIILPALLIASSAHLALFGPMMRYYALSALGVTCATLFLLPPSLVPPKQAGKPLVHRAVWYGIYLWIALASSYLTAIVIPAHIIYLLTRRKSESRPFWKALIGVLITSIPLIWLLVTQLENVSGNPWPGLGVFFITAIGRFCFTIYSFLIGEFIRPWDWWLSIPAFLAFCYLVHLAWKTRKSQLGSLLWLTLSISLPLGILALSKIGVGLEFSASRLFFLAPMFLILLALGPSAKEKSGLTKKLGTTAIVILVIANLVSTYNYSRGTNFIQSTYIIPWKQICEDILILDTPDTMVLHDDFTLMYWLPKDQRKGWSMQIDLTQDYDRIVPEEESSINRLLIIYSPRCFTETDIDNLISWYFFSRKDFTPGDSIEYLHEDETSVRFKSMLLRRQVYEVKKKLIVYNAVE